MGVLRKHLVTVVSFILVVAAFGLLTARVLNASHGTPGRTLNARERRSIGRDLARREPAMRSAARRHFPGDHWSQDDDFHNMEQRLARGVAGQLNVSLADVLRAIDEDIRAHAADEPGRRADARPCKPRPFYD